MNEFNIWNNIDFKSDKKKVLDYLQDQSKYLETATSGILKMQVETVTGYLNDKEIKLIQLYQIYVMSESLGNFRTKIITVIQDNSGPEFPVEIFSHIEEKTFKDVSEDRFLDKLNEILSNPGVQNVIVNLYKQSIQE